MGILPLQFKEGEDRKTLGLQGDETFDIVGLEKGIKPRMDLKVIISKGGQKREITVRCRIDTADEIAYYTHGGIMQYVLRSLSGSAGEKAA
jgi:aconitate hydratase